MRVSADSPIDPDIGSLFAPPRAPDGSSAPAWDPGRYVFEVSYKGPFAQPAWFGVDIIAVHPLDEPTGSAWLRPWHPAPRPRRHRRTARGHSSSGHVPTSVTLVAVSGRPDR